MRVKRKKKINLIYYVVVFLVISLLITVGYSLFSERFNIFGTAKSVPLVPGNELDFNLSNSGGRYSSGPAIKGLDYLNETLNGNVLTVNYAKGNNNNHPNNVSLTIEFANKYHVNLTNGVATSVIQNGNTISNLTSSLNKISLTPNEFGTLTVNFSFINRNAQLPSTVRTTIRYTVQGKFQYFYFDVTIRN
ncbi:MAG: hypothetical protein GX864_02980 [Mollicutes bacterium]|nr:hypothetical protein [Mollicutes bacterium]